MADTVSEADEVDPRVEEVRLAAQQMEGIAKKVDSCLANGGAACVSLTLTVALGEGLPMHELETSLRAQAVHVPLESQSAARLRLADVDDSVADADAPATLTAQRMPVVIPENRRWSSGDDADADEPVAWVFTCQDDGKVVRA